MFARFHFTETHCQFSYHPLDTWTGFSGSRRWYNARENDPQGPSYLVHAHLSRRQMCACVLNELEETYRQLSHSSHYNVNPQEQESLRVLYFCWGFGTAQYAQQTHYSHTYTHSLTLGRPNTGKLAPNMQGRRPSFAFCRKVVSLCQVKHPWFQRAPSRWEAEVGGWDEKDKEKVKKQAKKGKVK